MIDIMLLPITFIPFLCSIPFCIPSLFFNIGCMGSAIIGLASAVGVLVSALIVVIGCISIPGGFFILLIGGGGALLLFCVTIWAPPVAFMIGLFGILFGLWGIGAMIFGVVFVFVGGIACILSCIILTISLCGLVICFIPAFCSTLSIIFLCLPFASLCTIEGIASLGACGLILGTFPFYICPCFWLWICSLFTPCWICFTSTLFGCGMGMIISGMCVALPSLLFAAVSFLGLGFGALFGGFCCGPCMIPTGCLAPIWCMFEGTLVGLWTVCTSGSLVVMLCGFLPVNLGFCGNTMLCCPLWIGWFSSFASWITFVIGTFCSVLFFGINEMLGIGLMSLFCCCPPAVIPASCFMLNGWIIGFPCFIMSSVCAVISFIPLVFCGLVTWIFWIPCMLFSIIPSMLCPCIFEFPWAIWLIGSLGSCISCNLIDLVWLTLIPPCIIAGFIGGMAGFTCCPCIGCWSLPIGLCAIPTTMICGKLCYLGTSFPYTCWLEPVYLCWLGFDALFYFFGCLLAPVCIGCSIPLLPFSWCFSFLSVGALGCAACGAGCLTDIGIGCFGAASCITGTAISGMCIASLCTPAGLCVAGSVPVLGAGASIIPSSSKFMTTLTAVCPINKLVGCITTNLIPIINMILGVIRTLMFW